MFLAVKSNRHVSRHMEIKGQSVVESSPFSTCAGSSIQKAMANPILICLIVFPPAFPWSVSQVTSICRHTWDLLVLPGLHYDAK